MSDQGKKPVPRTGGGAGARQRNLVSELDGDLWAISPLDGRYRGKLEGLPALVSEAGLIGFRIAVEVQWLLHLSEQPALASELVITPALRTLLLRLQDGTVDEAPEVVKQIERVTNHDVKAVEYYLRERLEAAGASKAVLAFIHFACTSEDINNLSYALMLRGLREKRLLPLFDQLLADLAEKIERYAATPMLARTHGQTATPTTLGKELAVFAFRLKRQREQLAKVPILGKMNGAVGNFNAHLAAYPELDWRAIGRGFVEEKLKLDWNPLTTQIENHDSLVEFVNVLHLTNTILIGLCRDIWGYTGLGYFRQQLRSGEVGSSTMPHKVNPIDFENAEGNLGVANALAMHFADKLPISRFQRDLSDSTVLRTLGTLMGHTELAWRSLRKGLGKITADEARLGADLEQAWEVLAEPVQTVLRRYGVVDAYERLKAKTRGQSVSQADLHALIDASAELPTAEKVRLKKLTPAAYTGCAEDLATAFAKSLK